MAEFSLDKFFVVLVGLGISLPLFDLLEFLLVEVVAALLAFFEDGVDNNRAAVVEVFFHNKNIQIMGNYGLL